jgi:hypothetical protein
MRKDKYILTASKPSGKPIKKSSVLQKSFCIRPNQRLEVGNYFHPILNCVFCQYDLDVWIPLDG